MNVLDLTNALNKQFPGKVNLVTDEQGAISGSIISSSFTGIDNRKRMQNLWSFLTLNFSKQELDQITNISAVAPDEGFEFGIEGEDPLDFCICNHIKSWHTGGCGICTCKIEGEEACSCLEYKYDVDWDKFSEEEEYEKPAWITGETLSCGTPECWCDCHSNNGIECNTDYMDGEMCWEGRAVEHILNYFNMTKDDSNVNWSWRHLSMKVANRKLLFTFDGKHREITSEITEQTVWKLDINNIDKWGNEIKDWLYLGI